MARGVVVYLTVPLAFLLFAGCTSGVIGGGKPTTIECEGRGTMTVGPYAIMGDCTDKFKLKINVQ